MQPMTGCVRCLARNRAAWRAAWLVVALLLVGCPPWGDGPSGPVDESAAQPTATALPTPLPTPSQTLAQKRRITVRTQATVPDALEVRPPAAMPLLV